MTDLVLDASAGVELLFDTARGRRLMERLPAGARWWVPEHYFLEVGSAIRRAERTGDVSRALVERAARSLTSSQLVRVQIRPLFGDAWAKRHNLTIADALYVVLAEHIGGALVTADMKLVRSPALTVPTIHAGTG